MLLKGLSRSEDLEQQFFEGPDYAISKLMESSLNLVKRISDYKLAAIGISCGGPLDSKTGIIQSPPNLPGWDSIEMVNREALKPARDVCEIVPAALGDQIGDFACLSVAMQSNHHSSEQRSAKTAE